jgi:hypothetical protein
MPSGLLSSGLRRSGHLPSGQPRFSHVRSSHPRSGGLARALRRGLPVLAASAALTVAAAPAGSAATIHDSVLRSEAAAGIAGWTNTSHYLESTLSAGEGVATVYPPGGTSSVLYRGAASIPLVLDAEGWTHIGDPDSVDGYVFDNYQNSSSSATTKLYTVTTPSGASYDYVHMLVAGELYNNSFDAVSPDTQWMVSGEWGTMTHLQIYPTPILNTATSADGGTLALSGYVELDHQVNDVQGCDFVTATELICSSDDSSETLFSNQKPLLEIELAAPLSAGNVAGHVVDLGSIPQANSICSGTFESEGVDYDATTGILRVEIIQPSVCEVATTVYEYQES